MNRHAGSGLARMLVAAALILAAGSLAAQAAGSVLELTLENAVLTALERNASLRVQRLAPERYATYVEEELGSLDPVVSAEAGQILAGSPPGFSGGSGADAGVSLSFPTGTSIDATASVGWGSTWSSGLDLQLTQSLLAGGRLAANRARVEEARLDLFASRHELRGVAASVAAQVESAYWDHYLALRQRDIYRESLGLAERQLEEARARMAVGRIAGSELAAPRAEVTSRREALRAGEKRVQSTRQRLLLLVNPEGAGLDAAVRLLDAPVPPTGPLDRQDAHVALGLRQRPDLAQARLNVERGELEVVRTRAGLLPRLDLFIRLGGTGYAASFGDAVAGMADEPYVGAGFDFQLPLGNRAARARADRAVLNRDQAAEALTAMERSVEADIRGAWRDAEFATAGIASSAELRALQEEKLAAEVEKFRNGTSTSYLVAQAQRDLLSAQLAEAQAAVDSLLAMVALYRLEGSLLERWGIDAELR
jgi:outer membrane protein